MGGDPVPRKVPEDANGLPPDEPTHPPEWPDANAAQPASPSGDWAATHHVPQGWSLITQGTTKTGAEWRMYAQQQTDGSACYGIFVDTGTERSGGTSCGKPPIQVSGMMSPRLLFGIVTAKAAKVVAEHSGAAAETFPAVSASGFGVRFFAGEVAPQPPLTRVVAYDSAGKVVAEYDDARTLNGG
jgi:hypothetical protein